MICAGQLVSATGQELEFALSESPRIIFDTSMPQLPGLFGLWTTNARPPDRSRTENAGSPAPSGVLAQLLGSKPGGNEFTFAEGARNVRATQALDDRVVDGAKPEQNFH